MNGWNTIVFNYMKTNYLLSFVIPVWNREKTICYCLDSILCQAMDYFFEIIIVDDASTDNTVLMVKDIIGNPSSLSLAASEIANKMPASTLLFRKMSIETELKIRSRLRIVSLESHKGVAAARNKGLDEATGEYIWFVDSDDFIAVGSLKKIVNILLKGHFDIFRFAKKNLLSVPNAYIIPALDEKLIVMDMNDINDLLFMLSTGAVWCAILK